MVKGQVEDFRLSGQTQRVSPQALGDANLVDPSTTFASKGPR